ncbi:MAG: nucleotidyl transferase AbiEii/AbiGii toxin family protein [Bacteroidetes bacterium]|nr:nucleotidyl transferase AbiEii/AbiGii toxin family protein [Bacteroidota bacterium]MDA0942616.1 nucleotidyl transferase AbiEii/AbiGii toxin family protein [Bacteroidota bacterium]MDA1111924.1 nucleotidyl transferase AbiEii/AbiGii toxin family protein [Bacteroidota bacterium]
MNSFVTLSAEERSLFCRQAAERMTMPLPAAVIEKDFWVCWMLQVLNEIPDLQGNITFKGGTSLSKAWGLIERFSEDIDIAINRKVFGQQPPYGAEDAASNSQRKLRLIELEQKSAAFIIHELLPQLNQKISELLNPGEFALRPVQKGNEVNIEFEYPGTLKDELGGLLPVVLIELVPRADELPNENREITSIVFETFPEILGEGSFMVSTLTPERTFMEKLLFIHETLEGFNKGSERKSRHYYDLFKLYEAGVFDNIKSNRELLRKVVEHRQTFFRYNALDYDGILDKGVSVAPSKESLADWRSDYVRTAVMIYNSAPSFDELMEFAERFEKEFNDWVRAK